MKLRDVLRDVPVRAARADLDLEITAVTADSRLVGPVALFVAVPGTQQDGAKFIGSARAKGATAIVGETADANVEVDDPRRVLAVIAANFYGRPAAKLSLVGVTGTSGKTTTTKMIESILAAAHEPVGMIGTIEYRAGDERLVADRTTPDAVMLHQWFAKMVDAGVRRAVMEVSSHALALQRTYGIHFAAAVFTNLSQDHLDFHKDFEDYFAAKRILFDQIDRTKKTAIVNIDDAYGRRLADEMGDAAITFGRGGDRDKGKRPKMGEIAARMADRVVVTSDNPRGEEPKKIIEQIVAGIAGTDVETIENRRDAIAHAIDSAASTDVVVIAGKGHETYQVIGDRVVHFDDREEAELALKKRHEKVLL